MQVERRNGDREHFTYGAGEFPAYMVKSHLSGSPNYSALPHWHEEVELAVILSGYMDYNINSQTVRLCEGEGIFINARQIHWNYSRERRDCEYICMIFHPLLLCASSFIEQKFVAPLINHPAFPYQALRGGSDWSREICGMMKDIYRRYQEPHSQLAVQAAFFSVWELLYQNAPLAVDAPKARDQKLNALKNMISYIQNNYQQKLKLEDIAKAGSMSKTSCCKVFKKYVNQSPNAYLIEYRLRTGLELLRATDMTVTEICFEVGFSGPSYFSESFHQAFGCSPAEFRRRAVRDGAGKE